MLGDLERIRRGRMERQQRAIETRELMRLRDRLDIGWIKHRTLAHDGLGSIAVGDKADELDRHDVLPECLAAG